MHRRIEVDLPAIRAQQLIRGSAQFELYFESKGGARYLIWEHQVDGSGSGAWKRVPVHLPKGMDHYLTLREHRPGSKARRIELPSAKR